MTDNNFNVEPLNDEFLCSMRENDMDVLHVRPFRVVDELDYLPVRKST